MMLVADSLPARKVTEDRALSELERLSAAISEEMANVRVSLSNIRKREKGSKGA